MVSGTYWWWHSDPWFSSLLWILLCKCARSHWAIVKWFVRWWTNEEVCAVFFVVCYCRKKRNMCENDKQIIQNWWLSSYPLDQWQKYCHICRNSITINLHFHHSLSRGKSYSWLDEATQFSCSSCSFSFSKFRLLLHLWLPPPPPLLPSSTPVQ